MSGFDWQAVIAGVGGQGVLFVTRVLAGASRAKARRVLISEVHGMAQRGGSVVSHLKAGAFQGPLVAPGQAQALVSLEPGEAIRNMPFLAPGGVMVVNAPDASFLSAQGQKALKKHKVEAHYADATGMAARAGNPRAANVALLALAGAGGWLPFTTQELWDVLADGSPEARLKANQKIFDLAA